MVPISNAVANSFLDFISVSLECMTLERALATGKHFLIAWSKTNFNVLMNLSVIELL